MVASTQVSTVNVPKKIDSAIKQISSKTTNQEVSNEIKIVTVLGLVVLALLKFLKVKIPSTKKEAIVEVPRPVVRSVYEQLHEEEIIPETKKVLVEAPVVSTVSAPVETKPANGIGAALRAFSVIAAILAVVYAILAAYKIV